jgi:hypothetical protein
MRAGTSEKVRAQAHALRSTAGSAIRTNNKAARFRLWPKEAGACFLVTLHRP